MSKAISRYSLGIQAFTEKNSLSNFSPESVSYIPLATLALTLKIELLIKKCVQYRSCKKRRISGHFYSDKYLTGSPS